MSREKIFISESLSRIEMSKAPVEYLEKELKEDISVFPKEEQDLILRKIGGEKLTQNEGNRYGLAVNRWWAEKYGFSFINKVARSEVLTRKYAPAEEIKDSKNLQVKLLEAITENNEQKIDQIKKEYIETYPDQLEGVEVLFGIRDFLKKQKEFEKEGDSWSLEKRKERFRDFTEYQFLFTHFILLNNHDREFMDLFWKASFAMAERMAAVREFNILRRGQVSQVAVYKIIDSLGKNPKLSHPSEDAFNAIDLWTEDNQAIQIKGWKEEVPAVINSDVAAFPAIEVDGTKKTSLFNSVEYFKSKDKIFKAKIKKYGKKIGRDISGYMLAVPYSKIDFVTGEPAPELVEFFKKEIKIHDS